MERSKQIHLLYLTFGFLWSRLLTPHVCSAQALHTYFGEEKIKGREEKKGWRNEEKKRARTENCLNNVSFSLKPGSCASET